MEVFEIQIGTFPNQSFATTLNNLDFYFDLLTFGNELMLSISSDTGIILQNYRPPIATPFFVDALSGYLFFEGSYDWQTLNITSFLNYIPLSSLES